MKTALSQAYLKLQVFAGSTEAQDLVEYALIIALLALGTVASINNLAHGITKAFTNISATLLT